MIIILILITIKIIVYGFASQEQEADLAAFWEQRRGWWATHYFHLALASRLGLCSETQLYYRALCSRVILNDGNDDDESAFVRAVRGLLAPAADSEGDGEEEEVKREAEEGAWGLLFVPPPYIIGRPTAAPATSESHPPDADADADEYVELDDDADDQLDDEERPTEAVMRDQAKPEDGSSGRQQPPAWLQLRDRKREAARRQEEASTAYARREEDNNNDDDDVDEQQMKLLRHRQSCVCCGMRPRQGTLHHLHPRSLL
jgi:hypothetical protein